MSGNGPLVVGVTGATGHIGGLLLSRLRSEPSVGEVRSVARRGLPGQALAEMAAGPRTGRPAARLAHVQADITSVHCRRALDGCDLVYNLAAQVWRGQGPGAQAAMYAANVTGTANVAAADIGALVNVSSVAVYGAWPDNPLPLTEAHVARPNPECAYAQQKLVAEMVVAATSRAPWCTLRLCAVLGTHADRRVARSVQGLRRVVPGVAGASQALQWMDEADAVGAVLAAGRALRESPERASGQTFNVAPGDWLGPVDVRRLSGGLVVLLPRALMVRAAELARVARLAPFGADRAVMLNGPLAVSAARAQALLGWEAQRSSAQVLADALAQNWQRSPLNRGRP